MIVREVAVLFPAVGGFQFGRRPNVVLVVGEFFVRARSARSQGVLFVWARSAHSQARSACIITNCVISIRPKAKRCARRRRVLCSGAKRP